MDNLELLETELLPEMKRKLDYLVERAVRISDYEDLDNIYYVMKEIFAYPQLCGYCTYGEMDNCLYAGSPCRAGVREWLMRKEDANEN